MEKSLAKVEIIDTGVCPDVRCVIARSVPGDGRSTGNIGQGVGRRNGINNVCHIGIRRRFVVDHGIRRRKIDCKFSHSKTNSGRIGVGVRIDGGNAYGFL